MQSLSWIDNRTLLACQCIVVAVFAVMMLGLRTLYPQLRGLAAISAGFLFGIPAMILFTAVGTMPLAYSAVGGGACVFAASILLYRGLLQFCEGRSGRSPAGAGFRRMGRDRGPVNAMAWVYGICALAFGSLVYFSVVSPNTAACVASITVALGLCRGLKAWTLLRCAGGRTLMVLFGVSMAVFGVISGANGLSAMLLRRSEDFMQRGTPQTVTLALSLIFFCLQGVFYLLMFAGDVTESVREQAQLDPLAGTLNRGGIEDALRVEMARTRRRKDRFALMLIDIDHFKSINDRFGHAAGDEALREVAASIGGAVRLYDRLGRFGGDEFLLLLPQTECADAMQTAARIRESIARGTQKAENLGLTVSIGVTCCDRQDEMSEMIARADAAMYAAKRAGRDCERLQLRELEDDRVTAGAGGLEAGPALPVEGCTG